MSPILPEAAGFRSSQDVPNFASVCVPALSRYDHIDMASAEQVTVTLPVDLLKDMDRRERDRSKFVADAVRHELERRRREELERSLSSPHAESYSLAERGFDEWTHSLPDEDTKALVPKDSGRAIRWVPESGWVEG